ncbi:hypothetical protein GCK72_022745 [Caenorhabditis remanei]|uniref:Uncharacterized protein n=1 Tax=Caenorhabditis remanei TaxID=31234 RepID=A0A6A5FUQ9_CAERE|nr:hypothetical protein GCK72_022745 [Caenorhabditis remanei]KAF1746292.1 hypothetical protein GCK72_022745 [Caenorhabditis remanei]
MYTVIIQVFSDDGTPRGDLSEKQFAAIRMALMRKWREMYRDGEMDQELLDEKRNGLTRDLRQQTLVLKANEIPGLVKFIYDQNGVNI